MLAVDARQAMRRPARWLAISTDRPTHPFGEAL
jgi:hypothetical protein